MTKSEAISILRDTAWIGTKESLANVEEAIDTLERHKDPVECCGYDVGTLMIFGTVCRRAGVDEDDMKTFANNIEFAYKVVREDFDRCIKEAMGV